MDSSMSLIRNRFLGLIQINLGTRFILLIYTKEKKGSSIVACECLKTLYSIEFVGNLVNTNAKQQIYFLRESMI
jgi:hypothetical protein